MPHLFSEDDRSLFRSHILEIEPLLWNFIREIFAMSDSHRLLSPYLFENNNRWSALSVGSYVAWTV